MGPYVDFALQDAIYYLQERVALCATDDLSAAE